MTAPTTSVGLTAFIQREGRLPRLSDTPPPWYYRGWLLPYIIQLHELVPAVGDRWGYHLHTLEAGKLLAVPIPQIAFNRPDNKVFSRLHNWSRLIGQDCGGWSDFRILLDWMCWGLSLAHDEPHLSEDVNGWLYRQVDLTTLLETPHDYLGEYIAARKSRGWNPTGF